MADLKGKYPNGLAAAMHRKGIGPTALARLVGETSKQNIVRYRDQERKLPIELAERLAAFLDCTREELFFPRESGAKKSRLKKPREPITEIPLIDYVTAGKLRSPMSQLDPSEWPLFAFADLGPGEWFALRVEDKGDGDSMDRISPPRSVIAVNRDDRELIDGKCYIFSIAGETTYKMWQDGDPAYLAPYSTNPIHKPIFVKRRRDFEVIGRVKRTVLDL